MASAYDPEWTAFEKSMGERPALPDEIHARVQAFNGILINLQKTLPPTDRGIETREEQIKPNVKVRIYTPPIPRSKPSLPLILFIHGGGFHAGNLDTEDHICRHVCSTTSAIIISVEYRMVLSHKFPIPINDCYDAFLWAHNNAASLGADAEKYLVWGGSAGGGLAIATVYRLVNEKKPIVGLIAMAPMSLHPDVCPERYQARHVAYVENGGPVPVVNAQDALAAFDLLSDGEPAWKNSEWFPQLQGAEAFNGFPPTYIINTDLECFRDDGGVLELELQDAGVRVKREVMKGWPHYFWCFPVNTGGNQFREKLVNGIRWVLE